MRVLLFLLALSWGSETKAAVPDVISADDLTKLQSILPTMYYTPTESSVNCRGGYGQNTYRGDETATIRTPQGEVIATVCKRFERTLLMEGSAILNDRGHGEISVNYGGLINGEHRYNYLDRCKFGEGVRKNLCLLPYHTIAADNRIHKVNEIIFIPAAKGILLPDGTTHEGFFIVRDTGGAFQGIGAQRIDLFTGTDPDFENAFQKAGFHHKRPLPAFKVKGDSADVIRERLRERFNEIY